MYLKNLVPIGALALSVSALAQHSPYAGEQQRAIKALSEKDIADLQAGQGMGLAKAAELNGYPGPAHVLEHADALQLTATQRERSKALFDSHKAIARELGRNLMEAERALDEAFASKRIDPASLNAMTAEIGRRSARLREEHLSTHLAQTAILSAEQIRRYAQLRGYDMPSGTNAPAAIEGAHRTPAQQSEAHLPKPGRAHSGH
ncbi:Spy/CpxP family protein refolding chaperone [Variovorax sp. DT-64]|uniref:Spy/CpxP family protein refolding chaperone n=1 Tax=Variovorax sp. DT-64 TaxID=3396160 RepID=UPI003F1CB62A